MAYSAWKSFFYDPSVLFIVLCTLAPCVINYNDPTACVNYLLEYPCLIAVSCCFLFEFIANRYGLGLATPDEIMISRWYLINACGFHTLYDGNTGILQNWSLMTQQYNILDQRYPPSLYSSVWNHASLANAKTKKRKKHETRLPFFLKNPQICQGMGSRSPSLHDDGFYGSGYYGTLLPTRILWV